LFAEVILSYIVYIIFCLFVLVKVNNLLPEG